MVPRNSWAERMDAASDISTKDLEIMDGEPSSTETFADRITRARTEQPQNPVISGIFRTRPVQQDRCASEHRLRPGLEQTVRRERLLPGTTWRRQHCLLLSGDRQKNLGLPTG